MRPGDDFFDKNVRIFKVFMMMVTRIKMMMMKMTTIKMMMMMMMMMRTMMMMMMTIYGKRELTPTDSAANKEAKHQSKTPPENINHHADEFYISCVYISHGDEERKFYWIPSVPFTCLYQP